MASTVNEDSTAYLEITWKDRSSVLATPSSVEYRVDCATNARQLRGWTNLPSVASAMTIVLTGIDTSILDARNSSEDRLVTVRATHADGVEVVYSEFTVTAIREPLVIPIVKGDDYYDDENRQFVFTGGAGWPDLTSATVTFNATCPGDTFTKSCTVSDATGLTKSVTLELTRAETDTMTPTIYKYEIVATLTNGHVLTLVSKGKMIVQDEIVGL